MRCLSGANCVRQYAVWLVHTELSYMQGHNVPVISAWVNAFACLIAAFHHGKEKK